MLATELFAAPPMLACWGEVILACTLNIFVSSFTKSSTILRLTHCSDPLVEFTGKTTLVEENGP